MRVRDLKVGDEVGIAKFAGIFDGPGDRIRSVGLGTVVKANKVRVVVKRHSDGHESSFSTKYDYLMFEGGGNTSEVFVEDANYQRQRDDKVGRAKRTAEVENLLKRISEDAGKNKAHAVLGHVENLKQLMELTYE